MTSGVRATGTPGTSTGSVHPAFAALRAQFDAYLHDDPTYSAQLAILVDGTLVVDLTGGAHLGPDAVTGVFSATKGVAAVTVATLVDEGSLDLEARVASYWPEFAAHGKAGITVRQALSHQAGLVNTATGIPVDELVLSPRAAAERLAAAPPLWRPGACFGYHALTLGVLLEELVARVTGASLRTVFEERVRGPRDLDFYLGLPEGLDHRYRPVLPRPPVQDELAVPPPDGWGPLTLGTPHRAPDLAAGPVSPNRRAVRAVGGAGAGGVGSARGLAEVYAAALGHPGDPLVSEATLAAMTQEQCFGIDRVLGDVRGYGIVFQRPQPPRLDFGSFQAFGHDGAGGALGFADPAHGLAFGYIPAPMQSPAGADVRAVELARTARAILLERR